MDGYSILALGNAIRDYIRGTFDPKPDSMCCSIIHPGNAHIVAAAITACSECTRAADRTEQDKRAELDLNMGAKPSHTHCHYCDTVARVDGGAACAGCGELPAPIAAKVQASVTKHLDRLESLTVAQLLDRCSKAKLKVSNIPKADESKQLPRKAEIIKALRLAFSAGLR